MSTSSNDTDRVREFLEKASKRSHRRKEVTFALFEGMTKNDTANNILSWMK